MNDTRDRDEIVAHIHGLFDAYLRHDRAAIRAGHTDDWHGFLTGSRRLVRGLDAYMDEAETVLASLDAVRYEMLELECRVLGDAAFVCYLARDFLRGEGGTETTILLRSVDVYRREPGGWIQCASNICVLPDNGA